MYQILETDILKLKKIPKSVQENLEINLMISQLLYMRYQLILNYQKIPSFID